MLLLFRPAMSWDSAMLFEWRNDPETRANSRDSSEVDFPSHTQWFKKSLMNPDRKIMLAELGVKGVPVAVVRLDRRADGSFEVSWTVAPKERGKGYGTEALKQLVAELPRPIRLFAEIKQSNLPSLKIAERAGMVTVGAREDLVLLELNLPAQ